MQKKKKWINANAQSRSRALSSEILVTGHGWLGGFVGFPHSAFPTPSSLSPISSKPSLVLNDDQALSQAVSHAARHAAHRPGDATGNSLPDGPIPDDGHGGDLLSRGAGHLDGAANEDAGDVVLALSPRGGVDGGEDVREEKTDDDEVGGDNGFDEAVEERGGRARRGAVEAASRGGGCGGQGGGEGVGEGGTECRGLGGCKVGGEGGYEVAEAADELGPLKGGVARGGGLAFLVAGDGDFGESYATGSRDVSGMSSGWNHQSSRRDCGEDDRGRLGDQWEMGGVASRTSTDRIPLDTGIRTRAYGPGPGLHGSGGAGKPIRVIQDQQSIADVLHQRSHLAFLNGVLHLDVLGGLAVGCALSTAVGRGRARPLSKGAIRALAGWCSRFSLARCGSQTAPPNREGGGGDGGVVFLELGVKLLDSLRGGADPGVVGCGALLPDTPMYVSDALKAGLDRERK